MSHWFRRLRDVEWISSLLQDAWKIVGLAAGGGGMSAAWLALEPILEFLPRLIIGFLVGSTIAIAAYAFGKSVGSTSPVATEDIPLKTRIELLKKNQEFRHDFWGEGVGCFVIVVSVILIAAIVLTLLWR